MATRLYLLGLFLYAVRSLYTENSIIINVDVTMKIVSPLLEKANSNIQHIISASFQNTNQDRSYFYIVPISNFTYISDDDSFRYLALLNIYFISESEYLYAITKYKDIFSNDMNNFIETYQIHIYNELLRTLNVDSLSSNAVTINTLNMIQGTFIVNYATKHTRTTFNVYRSESIPTVAADSGTFVQDNLSIFLIIGAIIMLICFCCTMGCFWCSDRAQREERARRRHNISHTIIDTKEALNRENERSETEDTDTESWNGMYINKKDPFQWNTDEVTIWLKDQGLFSIASSNINGKDLLTGSEQMQPGVDIETNDTDKLMKGIKKLRLESNSYSTWRFENAINRYNDQELMRLSLCSSNESTEESKFEAESQSISKKKRKPPRKLRQRASLKKRKRSDVSFSGSSTVEIGRKSLEMQLNDRVNTNPMEQKTRKSTCELSKETEGSITENLYDSEDQQMY